MEGIAITHTGFEELAKREIKDILGKESSIATAALTFPVEDMKELCSLSYNARLLKSVMYKIASFKITSPAEFKKDVKPELFKEWLTEKTSFAVRCKRVGEHDFSSQEVEQELGEMIFENLKAKVDLSNPDLTVLVYVINDECHVGIDFAGMDLSKRDYRIFSVGESLKGTVAQAMNYIAEIKEKDRILDPFSTSGLIPIEAALYLIGKSPQYYNKEGFAFLKLPVLHEMDTEEFFKKEDLRMKEKKLNIYCSDFLQKNVRSAEKNAKIAGVNKLINFSRLDIEWLDTKFEEKSVNKIITHPPQMSKRTNPEQVKKLLDELFYVAKIILADDGLLVMIFNKPELLKNSMEKNGFEKDKTIEVWQGQECLQILILKKSKI
ncbi:THUMP domain-containing protein [Thermoproteota archaeon]